MKILHTVQRYYPDSGGSEEVVKKISEYLVSQGHDVTVITSKSPNRNFTSYNGVKVVDFEIKGSAVDGIRGDVTAFKSFIKNERFDIIMNYAAQIWSTDLFFEYLPELQSKMVLVPCGYSGLRNPKFADYYSHLPSTLRQYDALIYLSPNYIDTKFGEEHHLTNGVIIPNAADEDEFLDVTPGLFKKKYNLSHSNLIINVSNHSLLKGHSFFWNSIKQLQGEDIDGVLIGNPYFSGVKKWLKECYAGCTLHGLQPNCMMLENLPRKDVVNAYVDADVFVFGSMVECSPLVMFESFASRTLFVSTNCRNVADYKDIICLVENESEAVSVVRDYLTNKQKYQTKLENGYELFRASLNWTAIARQYEQLYTKLLRN